MDVFLTHSDDLEKEVRGDLVLFLVMFLLKGLLKPVKLAEVSSDSTEARIMHSDLLSGGLEPHLFHQLEEDQLVLMFAEAKMGHDSELVELLEE